MADNGAVTVNARTDLVPKHKREELKRLKQARRDYGVKDKKLRRNLKGIESKYQTAALNAKDAEILLENDAGFLEPETELERTYRVRQEEIQEGVSETTATKRFDLTLGLGPYVFEYDRPGKHILLGGRKGHVALMDWRAGKLKCELQLGETIRDTAFLADQYFAISQKKYVYIYDTSGVEIHSTAGLSGYLKWQDVSTGNLVTETPTKMGPPVSMSQNPYNAILHVGHQNGQVSLWSPNAPEPLVKLLAHKGPVRSLACDREGRYMVSTGQDKKMSVWDIRMFKEVNNYFTRTPASSVCISDRNLTAVGWGTSTTIWKDLFVKHKADQEKVQSPYMSWGGEGKAIERVRWCPFEDTLGVSHDEGFSSILVPGAGEANFDALEVNPFETARQRQESQVKGLLNKLQPEMIALDPNFIGNLDLRSDKQRQAERDLDAKPVDIETEIKHRMRGKNSAMKKYMRKQKHKNIIDEKKMKVEQLWEEQKAKNQQKHQDKTEELGPALGRFARKE
ncbi:hypothetical protein TruAng_008028 [Truncatella angustata]|nr:hypothetical protein TruAng_008028 [Truncatella angustata]